MMRPDDALLIAYLDGELDARQMADVEAAIAADPTLLDKLDGFRSVDTLLSDALAPALAAPMPMLRAQPRFADKRGWNVNRGWAIAAGMALVMLGAAIGLGGAHLLDTRGEQLQAQREAADQAQQQAAINLALEKQTSGTALAWRNPDTGTHGNVVPVRTFRNQEDQFCRQYRVLRVAGGKEESSVGVACREAAGLWRTRAIIVDN